RCPVCNGVASITTGTWFFATSISPVAQLQQLVIHTQRVVGRASKREESGPPQPPCRELRTQGRVVRQPLHAPQDLVDTAWVDGPLAGNVEDVLGAFLTEQTKGPQDVGRVLVRVARANVKKIGAANGVPRQDTINLLRAARIEAALVDGERDGGNALGRDTQSLDSIALRRLRDGKDAVHALQRAQVARIPQVVIDATQGESTTDLVERSDESR